MTIRAIFPAALLATLTCHALSAPAHAAVGTVDDEAGDASETGLDITGARLDNGDDALVVRVRFDRVRRGDLIVSVDPRGAAGLRLVSKYRPNGNTRNRVLPYAFSDTGDEPAPATSCRRFRVRWNQERDAARLRLPAGCLQDGEYGDVRFAVLTEDGGGDADYAPDNQRGVSAFVARG
jgi:hypothetical protein